MKKKWIAIILSVAVVSVVFGGCGSETKSPSSVNADSGVIVSAENEEDSVEDSAEQANSSSGERVSLEEAVIYDENGITVTATGIDDGLIETDIKLTVQNTTDKNILLTVSDLSVNGYVMSEAGLYCEVAAQKSANDAISIYSSQLSEAGIDTIANIEFGLNISDADTWDDLYSSDTIILTTSAGADYVQAVDDSGDVMYDSNNVKVVCKGLKEDDIWSGNVVFYIENNSDRAISLYAENVSVNGYMEDVGFWVDIMPGKKAIDSMSLLDLSDQEITSIDEVSNIEFSLRLVDEDTWDDIATTDVMTLNFDE